MKPPVPCPHCAQPILIGFRALGAGGAGFAGLCPECLHPYRLAARVRASGAAALLAFVALGGAAGYAFQHCAACVRLEAAPAFALVPVASIAVWLAGAFAAAGFGASFYAAHLVRSGSGRRVLMPVDGSDVATTVDRLRVRPGTAIAAAIALSCVLVFMLVAEWHAVAGQIEAARLASGPERLAAVATAAPESATVWFFVALEIALTAIVLACLALLLRKSFASRRGRGAAQVQSTPD